MLKILVVDDSLFQRKSICQILTDAGYEVVEATDGQDGLEKALSIRPDCILTDLLMPRKDGIEFISELKAKGPTPPLFVLTADIQESKRRLCMELGVDLSLLLLDLDLFKKVNDVHGHLFGDVVLKGVAKVILKSVRKTDMVSRYGGEEFAVLLPGTNVSGAGVIAENIRRAIEQHSFKSAHEKVHVTASVGVASINDHAPDSPQKLLDMADSALYCSKERGRNRIAVYSQDTGNL